MSGQTGSGKFVNVVPVTKIKKEIVDDVEDTVCCKICSKGFASEMALNNHARMDHVEAYITGNPATWTKKVEPKVNKRTPTNPYESMWIKTEEVISEMKPTKMTSLASNDVSYIIIKGDGVPAPKRRQRTQREGRHNRGEPTQPITGPFECLQPSSLVEGGMCHQIFFSCCEYSIHYRDEHTRRRKGLKCQVCEKPLACNGADKAPFPCEVCGEGFQSSKELSEHSTIMHVKLKPYECDVCHKRFTQLGGVLQHMRMHTGDRPYPCTFCPKAFTQKSGLDQHLRIHTKVRPYRCVVCSKSFSQSVHLKQHMRTHTHVAPFQCGICDKRFKQSSHLNYHLKNHNPANMSEEQKAKYSELLGMIAKEYVEVEVDQNDMDGEEIHPGEEMEMEGEMDSIV